MITVLAAHPEPLVALGIGAALQQGGDCELVGIVSGAAELDEALARLRPRVALLDSRLQRDDPTLLARLTAAHPQSGFAVMVEHSEDECILHCYSSGERGWRLSPEALARSGECCLFALRSGGKGCLPRAASAERLLQVVRLVAAGEVAAGPWLSAGWLHSAAAAGAGRRPGGVAPISAREMEVIALVADGSSNKEIAGRLRIREQTVKNHLSRIMQKLGVENRVELAVHAQKRRLAPQQQDQAP